MTAIRAACVLAIVCYAFLIVLVSRRAQRRKEARYFLLYLIGMIVWQAGYAIVAFTSDDRVALFGYQVVAAFAGSFGFFYAMFVRELLGIHSAKWLVPLGYTFVLGGPLYVALGGPGVISRVYLQDGSPMFLPDIGIIPVLLGVTVYGYMLYALYHLIRARRASTSPIERNRLTYLIIGVPIVIVGSAMNYSATFRSYPIDIIANVLNAGLTAFAILRYRLLDIQLVVRRGLRYSITTVIISTIYFVLVFFSVQVLHLVAGYQVLVLSVVLAAVAAITIEPLRNTFQARVDKRFFREKYDAAQMLQRLSRSSAALLDVEELTAMILGDVTDTMHAERAAFFLRDRTEGYTLAASRGLASEEGWSLRADHPLLRYMAEHPQTFAAQDLARLPLARAFRLEERQRWEELAAELLVPVIAKGSLVGLMALGPKRSGMDYAADDQLVLMTLANQTAVAVENARLYASAQQQLAERERAEARILESLNEKEVLLKEIHHRVKNNLQVIYSLLSLQSQYAKDQATLELFQDSQNRIRSMALIHEKLYQSANLADIDFGEYLRSLVTHLHRSYASSDYAVRLVVNTAPIRLPIDRALPCALVASELISNALKHAFVGRKEGLLRVTICEAENGAVELEVADDGIGLPYSADAMYPAGLGMQLVEGLVRQLDGSMHVSNGNGTRFVISFPNDVA